MTANCKSFNMLRACTPPPLAFMASSNGKVVAALAIGRIATVGPVNEALLRHFGTQGFQNTQAANVAVKNADSPF